MHTTTTIGAPVATVPEARPEPVAVAILDACHMIGCGRTMLYELMAAGEVDAITIGRRRLVTTASIRAMIDRRVAAARVA
jgi:hypothetical protein